MLFHFATCNQLVKILNPKFDLDDFLEQVKDARKRALLLDYDGTLAPFRIQRDKAFPYPGVREILNTMLAAQHSRIVLISGRWTRDLIPLVGLENPPEIWGSHGMERLKADGSYEKAELDSATAEGLQNARKWVDEMNLHAHFEHKPGAVALHWRGLPQKQIVVIREKGEENWSKLCRGTSLTLKAFDGGMELRAAGKNKGDAVKTILSEMGEGVTAAYLGDDYTDEDAFKAIADKGAAILVRKKFRETAADLWLVPPKELLEFLANWHKNSGGTT